MICRTEPKENRVTLDSTKTTPRRRSLAVLCWTLASLGCASAFSNAALAQNRETFTVGTATATRGQKATGTIDVPAGSDAGTRIPVAVIHGVRPGPVLALVSGAHGTEYTSIIALEQIIAVLDPAQLSGTVIVVPLVNIASFEQKVPHINPVDGKSMNRMYPGRMDGTQTDRASYLITKQVVEQCDHLIDLHGGDLDESLRPYGYWTRTGKAEQDRISREMVLAFGLDHIIISADRPTDPAASRYLENTATTRGKPSITVEAGHAGTVETDDLNVLVTGCLNVMRYLKMMPGSPASIEHPVWIERVLSVTSEQPGIFYPLVKRGSYVEQGMKLGYVTDYVGKTVFEARAPAAGVVLYICSVPSMTKGAAIANIGTVATDRK
ncbi:MAG TPA: M14 family metallopeptidase [Blastocatellia bacterium]|nr:M14 family metallopeptidase [Blastocatellia bacterium]